MRTTRAKPNLLFVLEQSLGHAVHGASLERTLGTQDDVDFRVVRISAGGASSCVPSAFRRNWSVDASSKTRAELQREFALAEPDALFIHTQVSALLAAKFMRAVPTVVSMDATPLNFDSLGVDYGHRRQAGPAERVKWLVNRRVFRAARALVAWSRWAGDSLTADYGISADKVHVIRPGVDLRAFRAPRTKAQGPVRILFVGGDFTRKGGDDLLAAMRRVRGRVELDIVTSAPLRGALDCVPVRVHTGVKPNSGELMDLYRRADIFALPSRGECYGLVISEALASGLPVVACAVGAMPEMVVDGDNGLLVPPSAPAALAEALQTLVDQPALRRTMGYRGRDLAEAEHDAGRNAQAIIALMRNVSTAPEPARASDR